ncbi:sensor histidine kinase [Nonomuraea cavernae]|uniref:sensor histidine kinase n=1 Tax=Nonomuraea cavernae TaxID=2045107 RepID=UPI0016682EE5|nr:sensor histidine kinase [Nonomuraea cavernae]MCA2184896.1 sensor histidine kinase [Nonomuraea cavernae]
MMRRALDWWSDHPQLADALLAAIACTVLLVVVPYSDQTIAHPERLPVTFWGDLLAYAALAWRRRFPVPVLALVWTLWFIGGRWDIWAEWNAAWLELSTPTALMLVLYTGGRWTSSAWTGLFLGGTLLPAALTIVRMWTGPLPFPLPAPPDDLYVVSFVTCFAAWGLGRLRRSEAEAVARAVVREEASRTQAALAEERMRIARELHDIVAHNVSAMVIQSAGANAALLDDDKVSASAAVEAIGHAGRTALAELRFLLGFLREGPMALRPGIDAIHVLAEWLPIEVRLKIEGEARQVPAETGVAAYRIVQEALTNTLKHAGKDASAEVLLRYVPEGLHIQVTDDGVGSADQGTEAGRFGHGLIGMRERAEMFGGTMRAGALPGGGFRVEATLRWTDP